jgi:hypothetical protein
MSQGSGFVADEQGVSEGVIALTSSSIASMSPCCIENL